MNYDYDAVIIGSGPNGMASGITLARAGKRVLILEAADRPGGGMRTAESTLPGFRHDICSTIHPFARCSPFFVSMPLHRYGVRWIDPPLPFAHPLDDGSAVVAHRSPSKTAAGLGADAENYRRLMAPLLAGGTPLIQSFLMRLPLPPPWIPLARFGVRAMQSANMLAERTFQTAQGKALLAGVAAHSILSFDEIASAAAGLALTLVAHLHGWPFPKGGAESVTRAMADYFRDLSGEIQTGVLVRSMSDLPSARAYLFGTDARQLLEIAGDRFPGYYQHSLENYRYGPGTFKVDYALQEPIPWAAPDVHLAGTVHLGGTLEEIALGEKAASEGIVPDSPFVMLTQPSLFDQTRAPDGRHTAWAYFHAPAGSDEDFTSILERQIERFAPGFSRIVLDRKITTARDLESYNPNYRGGDINAGVQDIRQLFTRPAPRFNPYATPDPQIFLCSSSTPPGGGIHGMSGYQAAQTALQRLDQ